MQCFATGKSRAGFVAAVFAVFLAGCGGSGGGSSSSGTTVSGGGEQASVEESVSGAHTVALSWNAPTLRVNGEQIPYHQISSYIVSYGQDPENLDLQAVLDDCTSPQCFYDIEGLDSGTWYFTVQTVDSSGLISSPSQTVSRTI